MIFSFAWIISKVSVMNLVVKVFIIRTIDIEHSNTINIGRFRYPSLGISKKPTKLASFVRFLHKVKHINFDFQICAHMAIIMIVITVVASVTIFTLTCIYTFWMLRDWRKSEMEDKWLKSSSSTPSRRRSEPVVVF